MLQNIEFQSMIKLVLSTLFGQFYHSASLFFLSRWHFQNVTCVVKHTQHGVNYAGHIVLNFYEVTLLSYVTISPL